MKLLLCFFLIPLSLAAQEHKFFDAPSKVMLSTSAAIYTTDTVLTCRAAQEDWLPFHNCGVVAPYMAASFASQVGTAYWLHKHHHHKLERAVEILGPVGSLAGIIYSAKNWNR